MRIPIAREGYVFIFIAFVPVVITGVLGVWRLFVLALAVNLFVINFFRDPERDVPSGENSIVSPADGRVIKAEKAFEGRLLNSEAMKISIFMNVFNVHVNRAPVSGRVAGVSYNPGKFLNASFDKASLENEQNMILVEAANGKRVAFCQIAGLIARRIVCYVKEGDAMTKGSRFGMIRFGSRLDVYLPLECRVNVKIGDKVRAGSSTLAYWK
ncbi:MAG TPA: phosphatidylserine decarboxylase family protein [Thermodesulfobacteriota bacterium]|nr:phosphatidylserine decarboxylase family protein [Thermodesulfobacteriota bacterium]